MLVRVGLLLPLLLLATPAPHPDTAPDFVRDVLPLLQRQGCASAYCHGSATGRGGFKLSLFGGDPRADWHAIVEELEGRRVDLADPEHSLVLVKPSGKRKHGGGRRLPAGGPAYETLRSWLVAGAPFGNAPAATGLRLVRDGDALRAFASFTDGSDREVTASAMFRSHNPLVAEVDADGRLTLGEPGDAWILCRYGRHDARALVRTPAGPPRVPTPAGNAIDRAWLAQLAEQGHADPEPVDAWALARRLHLDLVGTLPSPEALRRFAAADPKERVASAARALVGDPRFATHFASRLSAWLEAEGQAGTRGRIESALAAARPLDELATELLGSESGLLARHADPRDRAEYVARAFLGVRIGCARCHDHPLDRWRQSQHLAFAAVFGRVFDPDSGAEIRPELLPLRGAPLAGGVADFVLGEHHFFARQIANRVFAWLIGEGLVHPLDDHRDSNPASNEPLLATLTRELIRLRYDLRAFVVALVETRLYAAQRHSRPLDDEQWRGALAAVLGTPPATALPASPLARELALQNGEIVRELARNVDLSGVTLEDLFLRALSRPPSAAERERFAGAEPRELLTALILSREFGGIR
jgi:hypothetical protein